MKINFFFVLVYIEFLFATKIISHRYSTFRANIYIYIYIYIHISKKTEFSKFQRENFRDPRPWVVIY